MTMSKWDPFNDLLLIQQRMNRLFEDSISQGGGREGNNPATAGWSPAVDIYETAEKVVLLADLPGVNQEDINVRVENSTLVLTGERHMQKNVQEENYRRVERGYGTFQRSFSLPTNIDEDRIRAEHRNGILEISLPKTEGSRPKQIAVQVTKS